MQSTTAGPVTVERTSWDDAKAREQAGEDAFGWDAYRQECVRVNITSKPSIKDLADAGAARRTYGYPDPQGVCRVWLLSNGRGINLHPAILTRDTMEPAGFKPAPEIDLASKNPDGSWKYELLEAATISVTHGLGRGLPNWTKEMSPLECAPRSPKVDPAHCAFSESTLISETISSMLIAFAGPP
jgi:hypothetical protein